MNAGLRYLLRKAPVAAWRQVQRRTRGVKGKLALAAVVLLLALIAGPQLILLMMDGDRSSVSAQVGSIRVYAPLAASVMWFLSLLTPTGLGFRPSEVQFLFPAPIRRRQLVGYLLLRQANSAVLSGVWMGLFMLRHAGHPVSGVLALILTISWMQLGANLSGLLASALSVRLHRALKWALALTLVAAVLLVLWLRAGGAATTTWQPAALAGHPVLQALALPMRFFVELYLASDATEIARWTLISLGMIGAALAWIGLLDVAFEEGAVAQSRRAMEAIEKARTGGGGFRPVRWSKRLRVPLGRPKVSKDSPADVDTQLNPRCKVIYSAWNGIAFGPIRRFTF
jgi:hypothetical protein